MGLFSFITDLFTSLSKAKPTKGKKATPKSAKSKAGKTKVAKKKPSKSVNANSMDLTLAGKSKKKRKKSKQVSADPINADALGFSISLKDGQAKKRQAIRIRVDGLTVLVKRLGKQYPVTDISATGLGFAFEKPRVKGGVKLEMDLILNGETKIAGIVTKVMRHERGSVGCIFEELDRAQDDTVHAIVLLGQKQQAARKKAKKDKEFKIPE